MTAHFRMHLAALGLAASIALGGCANDNSSGLLSTSSLAGTSEPTKVAQAPKVDPACVTLTSQIDTLRKEGVADKVEKAAQKKHRLTPAEISKADQLMKANADLQSKCSTITPKPAQSAAAATSAPAAPLATTPVATGPAAAAPAKPVTTAPAAGAAKVASAVEANKPKQ